MFILIYSLCYKYFMYFNCYLIQLIDLNYDLFFDVMIYFLNLKILWMVQELHLLIMIIFLVYVFMMNVNELLDVNIFLNANLFNPDFFDVSLRGNLFLTKMIYVTVIEMSISIILIRDELSNVKLILILIIHHFFVLDDLILLSYK